LAVVWFAQPFVARICDTHAASSAGKFAAASSAGVKHA
jgi:hypothetical protein